MTFMVESYDLPNIGIGFLHLNSSKWLHKWLQKQKLGNWDQQSLHDVIKENENEKFVSVIDHDEFGMCGIKRKNAYLTHYNCLKDKAKGMKNNNDFNGEILNVKRECHYAGKK